MIIHDIKTETNIDQNSKKHFTIKTSAKAFKILSSQLYSDKVSAVIRELSANAADAHRAVGKYDVPFEVHMPTSLSPSFKIVDYGIGLTREEVETLYTTYFESTKNESNEFVGGLGIGSKTPLAYTNSFTVIARKNGEQNTFIVYTDDSGEPCINCIHTVTYGDGPAGLTVEVPVQLDDVKEFRNKIHQLSLFTIPYKVINGDFEKYSTRFQTIRKLLDTAKDGYCFCGHEDLSNKRVYSSDKFVYAVMGDIKYPIDTSLSELNCNENFAVFLKQLSLNSDKNTILIKFDIGELDIAPSREALSYDKQTVEIIKKKLKSIDDIILSDVMEIIEKAETAVERLQLSHSFFNYSRNATINKSIENLIFNKDKEDIIKLLLVTDPKTSSIRTLSRNNLWKKHQFTDYDLRCGRTGLSCFENVITSIVDNYRYSSRSEDLKSVKFYVIGLKTPNTSAKRLNEIKGYLTYGTAKSLKVLICDKQVINYISNKIFPVMEFIEDGDEFLIQQRAIYEEKLKNDPSLPKLQIEPTVTIDKDSIPSPCRTKEYKLVDWDKETCYYYTIADENDDNVYLSNFCCYNNISYNFVKFRKIHGSYIQRAKEYGLKHITKFNINDHKDLVESIEKSIISHLKTILGENKNPYWLHQGLMYTLGQNPDSINDGMRFDLFVTKYFLEHYTSKEIRFSNENTHLGLYFKNYLNDQKYVYPQILQKYFDKDYDENVKIFSMNEVVDLLHNCKGSMSNCSCEIVDHFTFYCKHLKQFFDKYELFKHVSISHNMSYNKTRIEHLKMYFNLIKGK